MADHQAPSREDVVSPNTPAPVSSTSTPAPHAVSAPTVSSPSTSAAGPSTPAPAPQRSFNPAESTPYTTYPVAHQPQAPYNAVLGQGQAPAQAYAPYPPTGYPAFPYYGAGGVPDAAGAAGAAPTDTPPKTYLQRLDAGEEHWRWKISLRVVLIILDIIAIGAASAVTAAGNPATSGYDWYYFTDAYIIPYTLITLAASALWCVVYVLVLTLRKPPRAVHPGLAVGMDLVLWLALIITFLFSIAAVLSVAEFGSNDTLDDPSYPSRYSGQYTLLPNDTWVFEVTRVYNYRKRALPTPGVVIETVGAPVSVDATATTGFLTVVVPTSVSPVSSASTLAPTPTEAPSAVAAKRALDSSSASASSYSEYDYDYSSESGYDYDYSTETEYDYYTYNYATTSTTRRSTTVTGSDLYYFTTSSQDYYRTTSGGEVFYATTYVDITATIARTCLSDFDTCADQDAFVNNLWHERGRRYALDLLVAIVQGIAIVSHFALFVWACVDTHRRNVARRSNAIVAMNVLQDMRSRGYVMVPAAEAMAAQGVQRSQTQAFTYPSGYAAVPNPQQQPMSPQPPFSPAPESSRAAEKAPMPHYA
ncbi:hypothetical protein F503_03412 [Ophiostoma piceae UAMH 11346]|uniref:Uncharacterized protein n=1 Tax=Ophiostoma piceae (strain UAMH 11346) TaxID=1262450 RepID=S3D140_OPHP1|nr:hypothetical protein F503_03412 [Ophiostoma piceae UAMH 11346]